MKCLFYPLLLILSTTAAAASLKIYEPRVTLGDVYFFNPGNKPALKYNHDVDVVKFKGRYFAAWNANRDGAEDVPGQFNYLSFSDDFRVWSTPVRMFTAEGGADRAVESDNQWQPNFINWRDEVLYCAWSDFVARRVYIAQSTDGLRWTNVEVPNAPATLAGRVSGFPTNHGLVTSRGVLLFPCSLPWTDAERAQVGQTRYAAVLRSEDHGRSWTWSAPIEAVTWSEAGENPAEFGGETITLWEPMVYERADGTLGLLIRNSTAQQNPERAEKPHRMLLYATSSDQGQTWSRARPVEVDTLCSRNFAVSGVGGADSLLMVMNDNDVRVPDRIAHDRFDLALYAAPVADPDLLLPGPVVQPPEGKAYYPNGFVDGGKMFLGYTYSRSILTSVVESLPDFSAPFLLPRGGRSPVRCEGDVAYFTKPQSCLGVVLTEALTRAPEVRLSFAVWFQRHNGSEWPILTLGGKTHRGTVLRTVYDAQAQANVFQIGVDGRWVELGTLRFHEWTQFEVVLGREDFSIAINGGTARRFAGALMRKISFGGLYFPPEWPVGKTEGSDVRVKISSIRVE